MTYLCLAYRGPGIGLQCEGLMLPVDDRVFGIILRCSRCGREALAT